MPRSFNTVEQAYAQLRRHNHGHHGCKDGSKARQFCLWLIVRANLSLGEITLFPPRTCYTSNILFDVAQYLLKNGMTHSHHVFIVFIFRRVFDRQFLHDVVEISPFIPSSDPLPCLSPSEFFLSSSFKTVESYKNY